MDRDNNINDADYHETLRSICWSNYLNQSKIEVKHAEDTFLELDKRDDILCLEKGRLFCRILEEGSGSCVGDGDEVPVVFELRNRFGQVMEKSRGFPHPSRLDLKRAPKGFRLGLKGQKRGGKLRLFIHPKWSGQDLRSPPYFRPFLIADVKICR